mgnify:FL=1
MVKVEGEENDLVDRIANDSEFGITKDEILQVLKPELYVGCAPMQVAEFLENEVKVALDGIEMIDDAEITV